MPFSGLFRLRRMNWPVYYTNPVMNRPKKNVNSPPSTVILSEFSTSTVVQKCEFSTSTVVLVTHFVFFLSNRVLDISVAHGALVYNWRKWLLTNRWRKTTCLWSAACSGKCERRGRRRRGYAERLHSHISSVGTEWITLYSSSCGSGSGPLARET